MRNRIVWLCFACFLGVFFAVRDTAFAQCDLWCQGYKDVEICYEMSCPDGKGNPYGECCRTWTCKPSKGPDPQEEWCLETCFSCFNGMDGCQF